jgi:pilus assembly protein CpaB
MRAKSLVLLLIAGVCGLVASIGISQVIDRKGTTTDAPMGELFVAVTDIDIAAKLDATNVKLDKWPKDRIPEGAITKLEDLKDKFPRTRLFAGEPILAAKLMDTNSGIDNSAKIPDGYRVVSVKVDR